MPWKLHLGWGTTLPTEVSGKEVGGQQARTEGVAALGPIPGPVGTVGIIRWDWGRRRYPRHIASGGTACQAPGVPDTRGTVGGQARIARRRHRRITRPGCHRGIVSIGIRWHWPQRHRNIGRLQGWWRQTGHNLPRLWEGAAQESCQAHQLEKAGQWALWGAWAAQQEVAVLLAAVSPGWHLLSRS